MTNSKDINSQLQDRVNALEAICLDLLTIQFNNPHQAKVKFDDYQVRHTQEALEARQKELQAKQLRENYAAAKSEFIDVANSRYWSLVFSSKKQRNETLESIWASATESLSLPDDSTRPEFTITEPNEQLLFTRKEELEAVIARTNKSQLEQTIKHCEQSIIDFTKRNEKAMSQDLKEHRANNKISESERDRRTSETQSHYQIQINTHIQSQKRQIESAKVQLMRLNECQEELKQVRKALASALTN